MTDTRKNQGITLIALVITIIILLILASVTMRLLINGGIIGQASNAAAETKRASAEEELGIMVADYRIEKHRDNTLTFEEYFTGKVDSIEYNGDGTYTVEYKGYEFIIDDNKYTIEYVGKVGGVKPVFDVQVSTTTGGSLVGGETEKALTINVINKDVYGSNYTIEVKDKNGSTMTKETNVVGSLVGQASFIIIQSGSYTITVTGTKDGVARTVAKVETITVAMATTLDQFDKAYGIIDIVWLDASNNVISTPEAPILGGMTPVKWDGTNWVTADANNAGNDWYKYAAQSSTTESGGTSIWANAKAVNGSNEAYFVWIPRYAYKITYFNSQANADAYRANSSSTIGIIGHSTIDGMIDVSTGASKLVKGTAPTNVTGTVKTGTYSDYIPHPAFEFDGAKKGIWVGKYQTSGTTSTITIKPSVAALRNTTVSNIFTACLGVKTTYSLSGDTHMMKNTEWGAVAYLTESKYGRNGTEVYINNSSSYITGNSGGSAHASSASGTTNAYNTANGVLASTTGNIYGVYDMSGLLYQYVAGFTDNTYAQSSNNTNLYNAEAKYKNVYKIASPDTQENNYDANKGIRGDAIYETSTSFYGTTSWHDNASYYAREDYPIFERGRTIR